MEAQSLNAYYQLIRLAQTTTLQDGTCILVVWRTGNKLAVSALSTLGDESTIDCCNWIQLLSENHGFKDDIHIEPLGWTERDGGLTEWVQENFGGSGFCIQWTPNGIKVSTSLTEYTIIKDEWK
jgi:hypothetical protein